MPRFLLCTCKQLSIFSNILLYGISLTLMPTRTPHSYAFVTDPTGLTPLLPSFLLLPVYP